MDISKSHHEYPCEFSKRVTFQMAPAQRVFSFVDRFLVIVASFYHAFRVLSGPGKKVQHPPHPTLVSLGRFPKYTKIIDFDMFSELSSTFRCLKCWHNSSFWPVHTGCYAFMSIVNRTLKLWAKFKQTVAPEPDFWQIRFWKSGR